MMNEADTAGRRARFQVTLIDESDETSVVETGGDPAQAVGTDLLPPHLHIAAARRCLAMQLSHR